MAYQLVDPDDILSIAQAVEILDLARRVDDPDALPTTPELMSRQLRFGWDLEPDEMSLFVPEGSDTPVGVLEVNVPQRENLHLVWAAITIHPEHRRRGHGTTIVNEVIRRTRQIGRDTIWLGAPEDDLGARSFVERFEFRYASHDARRRQILAEVDQATADRLLDEACRAAADYMLERGNLPTPDDVLEELVEVTSAINDAPMGDLTYEEEHFDLKRLQDFERAGLGRGDTVYRIWARDRVTREIAGHTVVATNVLEPRVGHQGDTAVCRGHRGHRLGLLLKLEMMRWLADREPQLEVIETWNNADNDFMISVNEAIGYRLSRIFAAYERSLAP